MTAAAASAQKRSPTYWLIVVYKLVKGLLFVALAVFAYALSDNNLPVEFQKLMRFLEVQPGNEFFAALAVQIGRLTEANILWAAAGTFVYSLFSLVEGVGLIFHASWAGWLAISESLFFIPIEVYDLVLGFTRTVAVILIINVIIVAYLLRNRERLFPGRR